jgi:hypothetical protein
MEREREKLVTSPFVSRNGSILGCCQTDGLSNVSNDGWFINGKKERNMAVPAAAAAT